MSHVLAICGRTCSGKTDLSKKLINNGWSKFVTTTTRPMREGEVNGVDYSFISSDEFKELLKSDCFIEHSQTNGNLYGAGKRDLVEAISKGAKLAIVVDPNGAKKLKQYCESEDVGFTAVFLDGDTVDLVARFLERDEINQETPGRIVDLVLSERTWRDEMEWDLVYDSYNSENDNIVKQEIVNKTGSSKSFKIG